MNRRASFLVGALPLLVAVGATPRDAFAQKITFGGGGGAAGGGAAGGGAAAPATAPKPASATPAAVPAKTEETIVVPDEWKERDQLLNEASSLAGGAGLLNTQHAQGNAAGQFRLGFMTEFFSSGFLCTSTFPCRNKNGGPAVTNDSLSHIGGTISLGVGITKWLEAYANTGAYANSDDVNKPSLLQVLGDTTLGGKYVVPLSKVFHVGLAADLLLVNGTGAVGLDGGGTSGRFIGLFTGDLRGLASRVPLRFSTNIGYTFDNTADVLVKTESAAKADGTGGRGQPVTRIERFGLNINRVDHLDIRIGGEFFAADERVRPFVEYGIALPNNRQGYACKPNNPSGDLCLANQQVAPSSLTLGVRAFPWKRGFSLVAALDIGVTGTGKFIEEVSPTPPWMLYIGGGWAIDTQDRPPPPPVTKNVEKRVEIVKNAIRGHLQGFVHEKDKQDPIKHAIIKYDGHPEMSPLASGDDGKFSDEVAPDAEYTYNVIADGYKPTTCGAKVPKAGGDVPVDCAMEALPKVGNLVATVRDADSNQPVSGISVRMVDAQKKESLLTTDGSGAVKIDNLMPGMVEFTISADNYLTLVQQAEVKVRATTNVDISLRPKPKTAAVEVGKTEIKIKQQIQFALDSAVILPESFGLMTEIADVLIRNPRIKRVEIQGHTDNTGTPEHNKQLSEQRADSVRLWLTQHGVPGDRLVARGFGQEKPLVPNVTAQNRSRNRRVQFQIVEQDPAAKP